MGENITTKGFDLLSLPRGTLLKIGEQAVLEITGLRNPCYQLEDFHNGLMAAVLEKDTEGNLIRKAGVMSVVKEGGRISKADGIQIIYPAAPHQKLDVVRPEFSVSRFG